MPEIGIPIETLNNDFKLYAPKGWNTFRIGESVEILIEVVSEDPVIFENNFGVRLFIYTDDQWSEVANLMKYDRLKKEFIVYPVSGNALNTSSTGIVPKLPDNKKATMVRIFLFGNIYRNGAKTDEKTGAYIDLLLKP